MSDNKIVPSAITKEEYIRVHQWVRKNYGKAKMCEHCNIRDAKVYDWALAKGFNYERNRGNFIQLCRSCHVKYDYTEERRIKNGIAQTGTKNNFYGRIVPESMKEKQRAKMPSRSIICKNVLSGEIIRFNSISEAYRTLGLNKPTVISFLTGKQVPKKGHYRNWKFEYN